MFADLNAPRFNRRKFRKNILTKELHEEWKTTTGYDKNFETFKAIWEAIATKIVSKIISETDGVRLGAGLGDMYIGLIPGAKRRPIDYKTSREIGQIVYHENWNTDGKLGKVIYTVAGKPYAYKLCRFWGFVPHTRLKKLCTLNLQQNPQRYKNSLEGKSRNYDYSNKSRANIRSEDPC